MFASLSGGALQRLAPQLKRYATKIRRKNENQIVFVTTFYLYS